ncbi:MAG: hypothetical protein JNJ49_08530 [Bdellovibrionaceae bacterium]|nr:hypothetical protein [Pseudobdellovibrionaceae bacterium]
MKLEVGSFFTFEDLKAQFGKDLSFTFVTNRTVKAIGLVPDMNVSFKDNVPDVGRIMVAKGDGREAAARLLRGTQGPIPVFVKEAANKWKFIGEYIFKNLWTDPADFRPFLDEAPKKLDEIVMVVEMNRVKAKEVIRRPKTA